MRITSPKLDTSNLTSNEAALLRCQRALELKDKGDYLAVQKLMLPLWRRVGERPKVEELHPSVAAEVLLSVGIFTRWIGSRNQVTQAQETAKNLITESITFYESIADVKKVAEAQVELACCYWREGALDEARITLNAALQKLTTQGNTRARALLRLAIVEWSASRFSEALKILTGNGFLFSKITNHAVRGAYHSQLAMVLRKLTPSEKRDEHFKRILKQYLNADYHFKLAHNIVFRADVKNNIGNLLRELSRFREAHEYLAQARRLRTGVKDKIGIAQIDDTRAQVFLAQGKPKEAEAVARGAARVLEKSGHQCLLTDALITHGIALARLKQTDRAQFIFQKAIEVARQVGALNKAGLAALTMIEELDDLSPGTLSAAYDQADWLATSQSQELSPRLHAAARKVFLALRGELSPQEATEALLNKPCNLHNEVLKFEGSLIQKALAQANGGVTRAASFLQLSYQGLAYIIEARHKDLQKQRSPIRRRTPKARRPLEE